MVVLVDENPFSVRQPAIDLVSSMTECHLVVYGSYWPLVEPHPGREIAHDNGVGGSPEPVATPENCWQHSRHAKNSHIFGAFAQAQPQSFVIYLEPCKEPVHFLRF